MKNLTIDFKKMRAEIERRLEGIHPNLRFKARTFEWDDESLEFTLMAEVSGVNSINGVRMVPIADGVVDLPMKKDAPTIHMFRNAIREYRRFGNLPLVKGDLVYDEMKRELEKIKPWHSPKTK